jgi:hypothetical protein
MPEKETLRRARRDAREGKSPSTQAGEFVREEIRHVREGKHGAKSAKQAIAIGLSKARRAGVKLPGRGSKATRKKAAQDMQASERRHRPSATRARATERALEREPSTGATRRALSRQAKSAAQQRTHAERSGAAKKAARTRKARGH